MKRTYKGSVMFKGDRVSISPYSPEWRNGNRYGTVDKVTQGGAQVHVLMDETTEILKRHASMWRFIPKEKD